MGIGNNGLIQEGRRDSLGFSRFELMLMIKGFVPTLSSSRFPTSRATLAAAKSSSSSINWEEFRSNSGLD
ncbi:hypothetical protein AAC387_Pa02g1467 [Persea americana]